MVGTKRTEYAYALSILDQAVGAIVSTLERLDMMDNTYLIFASDNGGVPPHHTKPHHAPSHYIFLSTTYSTYQSSQTHLLGCYSAGGKNGPLRGTKGTLLEGGTKVDAFVYSPTLLDRSVQGTTYSRLMHVRMCTN